MYTYKPSDKEHIHIIGRTIVQDPLPLFWTASGIEFTTTASECSVTLECDYDSKEQYIRAELDGFCIQRFMVPRGTNTYCLFKGLETREDRSVTIKLESQPMEDDENRKLLIHEVICNEELRLVTPKPMKIEIIGDSLTSGEGLTGMPSIKDWCPFIYGLNGHYGLEIAKAFNADYSIVSQSGWGVYCGWDNNLTTNIPRIYKKVCGVVKGASNEALGASKDHDFAAWQPDLVVINLGTNDGGATGNPAWTDPDTGIEYKQKFGEDGMLDFQSEANLENGIFEFLTMVRECNPNAQIVWCYGMCDHIMELYITEAIKKYKTRNGDKKVHYVSLPEAKDEQLGAHWHPGFLDHQAAADVLIKRIKDLFKEDK